MSHPVVLALFDDMTTAATAARELRSMGVPRERVSVVATSADVEGRLARASGASPGSEIEESLPASQLGELGAHMLAAVALVMPGIGTIVADGPLSVGMAEAAGHLAGDISRALVRAEISREVAEQWEGRIRGGGLLVGAHVETPADVDRARSTLVSAGAADIQIGTWPD